MAKIKHNNFTCGQENQRSILAKTLSKIKYLIVFIIATFLVASGLFLRFSWQRYNEMASSEAIQLAQSMEALVHPEHIKGLTGSPKDVENPEYIIAKKSLVRLVGARNNIHFAYFLKEQSGKLLFLMDSATSDSPYYSPPGQVYEEADDIYLKPFITGDTILANPISDRWGNWISVLVPIKDTDTGNVIALFGIDFSVSEWYAGIWKNMIPDIIIIIFVLILSFALLYAWYQSIKIKTLRKQLAYDEMRYHMVFEQAPIGIAIVNDKKFVYQSDFGLCNINPMFEKILGRSNGELENINWPEITHPDDLKADLEKFELFKRDEIDGYSMEKRFIKPDGSIVWVNMSISTLLDAFDRKRHLCIIYDISARKEAEDNLRETQRRESVLLANLPGLAYRCNYDKEWTMQFVSAGCFELTEYPADSLINNKELSYNELISPEYREVLRAEWARVLAAKKPFKYEYEIITASGERKWVIEMGQGIFNPEGEIEALEGIVLDISDRKKMENNLRYLSEHDRLTGLYNRDYLEFLFEKDKKNKDGLKRALIGINLSTVQVLTANYGFHYTQNLIKNAANELRLFCSDKRMLFHTYDNRFVFYISDYKDKKELIDFSEVISEKLESVFATDRIGGGIAIYEIEKDAIELDIDLLLRKLLIASEQSINVYDKEFKACFYNEEIEALVNRERDIMYELSEIVSKDKQGELFLQYQPILNLKTNAICGFEALARLKTDNLGIISPLEFIRIAEKTKLIIPLGEKIIIKALHFLNRLKEQGYDSIGVAINISAIQLMRQDFANRLFEIIDNMRANPNNIGIEITESVFTSDYDKINDLIDKLKSAGLKISIDDFGTGYSSLARERELKANNLKIDKFFIDKLLEPNPDKSLVSEIISIAHKLGHSVIAEGVEYEKQLQLLKQYNCDKVQGYFISRPIDEEDALAFLRKQGNNLGCENSSENKKGEII